MCDVGASLMAAPVVAEDPTSAIENGTRVASSYRLNHF